MIEVSGVASSSGLAELNGGTKAGGGRVSDVQLPSVSAPSQSAERGSRGTVKRRRSEEDLLEQPIHRFPPTEDDPAVEDGQAADESERERLEAVDGAAADSDEIFDSTQPDRDFGVSDSMATLAINPDGIRLGRTGGEGMDSAAAAPTELHLNGDFGTLDDAAIMLELKAGNMAAFDVLINKYRKPIVNFMYRMTRNQGVAEELAQEVFLRVFRSRETYRAEARFSTWVYRIATNLGVNHARDTRHERTASTVYLDEPDAETGTSPDVADQTPGVEARLLRDERMAAIRDFVMALPERQKMAVLMHKYEGMDYKQIGDVLKLSESATKSLLFRAYQTLREKLKVFV